MQKIFDFYEDEYKKYLNERDVSERTVYTYITTVKRFFKEYKELSEDTYDEFLENIQDNLKANSTNSNIRGINNYIDFLEYKFKIDLQEMKHKLLKIKKVQFLDDILTIEQYDFLCKKAKLMGKDRIFILCRILGTTGMRIHEALKIQQKHIKWGFIDYVGKGSKERRTYFTDNVKNEILAILEKHNIKDDDYILCNSWNGKYIDFIQARSMTKSLTLFAESQCEFDKGLVHPHMFRHFFAKNFIQKYQNIALLADLLGHSSIETTRIYLKYTSKEQQDIINQVVTW